MKTDEPISRRDLLSGWIAWLTDDDRNRGPACRRCGHDEERHQHHHTRTYCGTCGPKLVLRADGQWTGCPSYIGPGVHRSTWLFVLLLLAIMITALVIRALS